MSDGSACPPPGQDRGLVHQALVYGSSREFLDVTVPFCLEGLARDEAVLAVTTPANAGLLREAMGGAAERVEFADSAHWYRTPGRTLAAYHRYVGQRTGNGRHRRVRIIGEPVWHGRDPLETAEWTRYESAINIAFAGCAASIVCPYDTRVLPRSIVADARRTHPQIAETASPRPSGCYTPPATDDGWRHPPAPLEKGRKALHMRFEADLSAVRRQVADTAARLGLPQDRIERLVFAVNEVATNAVQHGRGSGTVTVRRAGRRVVCDVTSTGGGDAAWYLGYLPPSPDQTRGHGMWVVRQLCDLLEVHTDEESTTVRVHVALS